MSHISTLAKTLLIIFLALAGMMQYQIIQETPVTITAPEVMIGNEDAWLALGDYLKTTPHKIIIIRWEGYGGDIVVHDRFIDDVEAAKKEGKTIIFDVEGIVYSAMANTVCHGSLVVMHPGSGLGFHNVEPHGEAVVDNDSHHRLDECVKVGYLTPEDVVAITTQHKMVGIIDDESGHISKVVELDPADPANDTGN